MTHLISARHCDKPHAIDLLYDIVAMDVLNLCTVSTADTLACDT